MNDIIKENDPAVEPEHGSAEMPKTDAVKSKSKKKPLIVILSVILAVILVIPLFSLLTRKTIDMKDYITVTYSSFNGRAKPSLDVDYSGLENAANHKKIAKFYKRYAMKHAIKDENDLEEFWDSLDDSFMEYYGDSELYDLIDISFAEEYSDLSNGDKITVKTQATERLDMSLSKLGRKIGLKFKNADLVIKVEGLADGTEIDLSGFVKELIGFSGANGYGKAEINVPDGYSVKKDDMFFNKSRYSNMDLDIVKDNRELGSVEFEIKEKEKLSGGDKITVEISCGYNFQKYMTDNNCYLKDESVEITVPKLGKLITDAKELTAADIKEITDKAAKLVKEDHNSASEIKLVAKYFDYCKENAVVSDDNRNAIEIVFYVNEPSFFFNDEFHVSYEAHNLVREPDGTLSYGELKPFRGSSDLNTFLDSWTDIYNYTEIK